MKNSSLNLLWQDPTVPGRFSTAVSLHAHSRHSRETLGYAGSYRRDYILLQLALKFAEGRLRDEGGNPLPLSRIVWNPPLSPEEVIAAEAKQIERLGLRAMVSLTDHDTIAGRLALQGLHQTASFPVSLEWTVPFPPTVFHLGVHNLEETTAAQVVNHLLSCTEGPAPDHLHDSLDFLNRQPGVLVVLNHPLWDGLTIGEQAHREALRTLLTRYGKSLHALELNGYRPWRENRDVLELARAWNMPVVSGGDRHGTECNTILNLTRAETFADFVAELRYDGVSQVLFLPRYREPWRLRCLETAWDYIRTHTPPSSPPNRWTHRFFYRRADGSLCSLSSLAGRSLHALVESLRLALKVSRSRSVRPALRVLLADAAALTG